MCLLQVKDSIEKANKRLREEVDTVRGMQQHAVPTALYMWLWGMRPLAVHRCLASAVFLQL
jgi:hypothetical protein